MQDLGHNSERTAPAERVIVLTEANSSLPLKGDFERMARRRHQSPKPFREGNYWWIKRVDQRFCWRRAAEKTEANQVGTLQHEGAGGAEDRGRTSAAPINQSLESIGSATNFATYVNDTYIPVVLALMATSTRHRYRGIINNYLLPKFGELCLRDLGTLQLQRYFSAMATSSLAHESRDKIRDVLSGILGSAVRYQLLVKNPIEGVQLPPNRRGRRITKPNINSEQFDQILAGIPEPYATMVYVAVYSGLRVSELIGLRWNDVGNDCLMVDERCCRGDWSAPKSEASNAPVAVQRHVIERIHALKLKTVFVRAGRAVRKYKAVKSDAPNDLVFQSVKDGKAMRDNNILSRFIKPAARKVGLGFVNWRCLRTSYGTWLKRHGADMKDIQGQMRHSRISTTMDIYVQDIPESRRQAVEKLPVPSIVQ